MKFNKKVLKSGLTILHEKRDVPVTTIMLATRFGSGYENEQEKGIAHFLEHLGFKGTKKRSSKEIVFTLEKVGGIMNASTDEELVYYYVKLPSQYLGLAIDVISDIFFNPIFPEQEIKKEANVICEEIKMYYDSPFMRVMEKIKEDLYEKPFGIFGAGTEENVRRFTRNDLIKKHSQVYVPENAILCVVGNNDFNEVVRLAEKFCIGEKGEKIEFPEIRLRNLKETEKRENLQQASIAIGFHFPKTSEKQRYAGEVFSAILGRGLSSKLSMEIREKRGLVYIINSGIESGKNYGYMIICAGTDKDKVKEVINLCIDEFKKMKDISKEELEEAKKQVIGNYEVRSEDSEHIALSLISEEISGKAEDYYEYKNRIKEVSLDDIKNLAGIFDYSYFVLSP